MKNRIVILIFVSVLSSINCFTQDKDVLTKEQYQRIYHVPDSLLTKEEQVIRVKLYDLLLESIYADGKKLCTSLKESDFKKNDIPLFYYNDLMESINEINAFYSKNTSVTTDKIKEAVDELKKDYGRFKEKGMKK